VRLRRELAQQFERLSRVATPTMSLACDLRISKP